MTLGVGAVAEGSWWGGIGVFVLFVVPVVVVVANRLVRAARRIRDATADVAEQAGVVREHVESLQALEDTARLLEQAGPLLPRR